MRVYTSSVSLKKKEKKTSGYNEPDYYLTGLEDSEQEWKRSKNVCVSL